MRELGIILDATHLCDDSFWEALDAFDGPVWASHNNCRALVPHNRQFADEQIQALVERGAVIGAALDAWMIVPGLGARPVDPESAGVTLSRVVDHIDHICQVAGNARHCGIGSDLDGAFGREQTPPTSTPSPICRGFPTCCARAATAKPTSPPSHTATSSRSSGGPGRRVPGATGNR